VSMKAVCVALQSVAAQDASVFRVCESCMTPGTVDHAVRRPLNTRHVATHKTFTHTPLPRAVFYSVVSVLNDRRKHTPLQGLPHLAVVHSSSNRPSMLIVHCGFLQSCLNCRESYIFSNICSKHVLVLSFILQVPLIVAIFV
jgi:hypothetical protein